MPHVIFHSPFSLDEIGQRFAPFRADTQDIHIRFLELFQSRYDSKLFVETFVKEEPLEQRIGIAIELRPSGDYLINLREMGFPRPTPGVRLAIHHLAEWIKGLHSETKIIRSNLFLENGKEVHQ